MGWRKPRVALDELHNQNASHCFTASAFQRIPFPISDFSTLDGRVIAWTQWKEKLLVAMSE
jgi:hypothetical protein